MIKIKKDKIMTVFAVVLLLFTALINWNIYSWLILLAAILITFAWYYRK
jgi:hypothetical protein